MSFGKSKYVTVVSILMWVLLAIGVGIVVWGAAIKGLPATPADDGAAVNVILYWAYVLVALALACIIVLGLYTTAVQKGMKGILKLLGVCVGACVVVAGAYLLAKAQGGSVVLANGAAASDGEVLLTNTMLNLTYLLCGIAVLSIVFSAIFTSVRK